MENINVNKKELYQMFRECWMASKRFYSGKTDTYFFDWYDIEVNKIRDSEPVVVWINNHKISSRLKTVLTNVADEYLSFKNEMLYVSKIEKSDFLKWRGSSLKQWEEFVNFRGY